MIFIGEPFRELFNRIGFSPERIFTDPAIKPWRTLPDRENCVWDLPGASPPIRLHVKRFPAGAPHAPAESELRGYRLLAERNIPTATVAASGILDDGRSFIAVQDLTGFAPADKLVESGTPFESLLVPTADLAAGLHGSGLHHRDLYLCHFMARLDEGKIELRLIDAARVRPLPALLTRRRWIVKDLAQFRYSTTQLPITGAQRQAWLIRYVDQTGDSFASLDRSTARKCAAIAAHDLRLRRKQPGRNISIPGGGVNRQDAKTPRSEEL